MKLDDYSFEVVPLSPTVGAEIRGVDLATPCSDQTIADIRRALGEFGVIFFRNQDLEP